MEKNTDYFDGKSEAEKMKNVANYHFLNFKHQFLYDDKIFFARDFFP